MKTNSTRGFVCVFAIVALTLFLPPDIARGDWNPGEPHKMHYPQLPDPQGWDVNMTYPKVLADDWRCSETGPVGDVHFWFSIERDSTLVFSQLVGGAATLHVSIHSDIPAPPTGGFSRPGALLWDRDYPVRPSPTPGTAHFRPYGTGDQGWYDPNTGEARRPDHINYYQMNIENIVNPFFQQFGTIYWLDLSIRFPNSLPDGIGWKTSLQHYNDDGVWGDFPEPVLWHELRDPLTQQSLDLAFVITPEPGTLAIFAIGALGMLARRRSN